MNLRNLNDQGLLDELHTAQNDIVEFGNRNVIISQEAWQRVVDATRELERRFPPQPLPLTDSAARHT